MEEEVNFEKYFSHQSNDACLCRNSLAFWKRSALPLYLGDRCKSVADLLIRFSAKRQVNVFPIMQNYWLQISVSFFCIPWDPYLTPSLFLLSLPHCSFLSAWTTCVVFLWVHLFCIVIYCVARWKKVTGCCLWDNTLRYITDNHISVLCRVR